MIVFNKAKNMALKLDENAITEESNTISGDTISNFKNLQENLGPLTFGGLIDYDTLLERLYTIKHPPNYLFDFTLEKREKEDEELTLKFSLQEKSLLQKFQETIVEIHNRKDHQAKLRIENHTINTKIKALKDQNEKLEHELVSYEEMIRKKGLSSNAGATNKPGRRKARDVIPSSLNLDDHRKLDVEKDIFQYDV